MHVIAGILGGIGATELLVILAICLLIFGPKNLPKLGNALGKSVKSLRKGMEDDEEDPEAKQAKPTPTIAPEDVHAIDEVDLKKEMDLKKDVDTHKDPHV